MFGNNRGLLILTYHRVLTSEDPLRHGEMTAEAFERHCSVLRRWFNVLPLLEGWRRARENALPSRAVSITFDDGYADNAQLALPILQRHGLPATFFVATGYVSDRKLYWWERIAIFLNHARVETAT